MQQPSKSFVNKGFRYTIEPWDVENGAPKYIGHLEKYVTEEDRCGGKTERWADISLPEEVEEAITALFNDGTLDADSLRWWAEE